MSGPYRANPGRGSSPEPFPDYQDHTTTSVTTSTTTQTVIGDDGDPVIRTTTTPAHPTGQSAPGVFATNDPNNAPTTFTQTRLAVPSSQKPLPPPPPQMRRQRPISIRRLPSAQNTRALASGSQDGTPSRSGSGRRRATSAPQEPHLSAGGVPLSRNNTHGQSGLAPLQEETLQPLEQYHTAQAAQGPPPSGGGTAGVGRRRSLSNAARSIRSRLSSEDPAPYSQDYEDEVVDLLDVIGRRIASRLALCIKTDC